MARALTPEEERVILEACRTIRESASALATSGRSVATAVQGADAGARERANAKQQVQSDLAARNRLTARITAATQTITGAIEGANR